MTKFVVIVETTDLTKDVYGGYRTFKRAEGDAIAWGGTVEPVIDQSEHKFKLPPKPTSRYTQGYDAAMALMMARLNTALAERDEARQELAKLRNPSSLHRQYGRLQMLLWQIDIEKEGGRWKAVTKAKTNTYYQAIRSGRVIGFFNTSKGGILEVHK